jgi:hypothetical protein
VARQVIEYRVLLISPGDMTAARDAVRAAIADWNAHVGPGKGVRLEAVGWESHVHPATGTEPQAIINKQIVEDADVGIALFGARLGSATSAAPSGSAEEIDLLAARGAPLLIYRSTEPVKLAGVDLDQVKAMRDFLDRMKKKALLGDFESVEQLRRLLTMHLTKVVDETLAKASTSGPPTAAAPDVRVNVSVGMPMPEPADPYLKALLSMTVENHSPSPFFFANYHYELEDGRVAQPMTDALTSRPVTAQQIEPGNSITYTVSAPSMMEQAEENQTRIKRAVVVDKIGRKFYSSTASVEIALHNAKTVMRAK